MSSPEKVYIYGKHALEEALIAAPHAIKKVFLSPTAHDPELVSLIEKNQISLAELKQGKGGELVGSDATHQGVIAVMDPSSLLQDFDTFIGNLEVTPRTAVAILGEVQDPHNVGAIIRSAAAFGLAAVLIPEHRQAGITGTVVKTSAGMAFRIPLVTIGNVNYAIRALKEKGFWVYGLAMDGAQPLPTEKFDAPAAFVIGNEGEGIREKTLELCDIALSIPMHERTESLNAAVSAGVVFYAWNTKVHT